MNKRWCSIIIMAVSLLLFSSIALSQISPGKLSSVHEDLKGIKNCNKCHELGKEFNNKRCLECHEALQSRILAEKGYHSSKDVADKKCSVCHSEHHGREYELVFWKSGVNSFKHSLTGYLLEGKHHELNCRSCHRSEFVSDEVRKSTEVNQSKTFLGLDQNCTICHLEEHRGQLPNDCLKCHDFNSWVPATGFNHDDTQYKLTGSHLDLDCSKCHEQQIISSSESGVPFKIQKKKRVDQYSNYSLEGRYKNCTPCHKDQHEGRLGANCSKCHNTKGFSKIVGGNFDHNTTNFPLVGKHLTVACDRCHIKGTTTKFDLTAGCKSCHDDQHNGQFVNSPSKGECVYCHDENGFLPALYDIAEHDSSRYPLTGSHLAVPCFLCHVSVQNEIGKDFNQYDFDNMNCNGCHQDMHRGQVDIWIEKGGCEYCHNIESWHKISFDHGLARFQLAGKHKQAFCLSCHKIESVEGEILWIKPLSMNCDGCHNDIHNGQFAEENSNDKEVNCKRCHVTNSWKDLQFDHNSDSRFKLEGAHAQLECFQCHQYSENNENENYIIYKPKDIACNSCHGGEELEVMDIKKD
ncbi:MAG: hypothetical protein P9L92_15645 [Candidatus Electryonea clarkiae]|nr:hypothetical protein [Candidatus Electryonea clarkiae]MDP8287258.1 hypothetical protein [Candidatus Electryonea clarkiae]